MIPEYRKNQKRINDIINLSKIGDVDDLIRSSISSHIIICQSGLIENLFRERLTLYVYKRCEASVARYAAKRISGIQNPTPQKIEELMGDFDESFRAKLIDFWAGTGVRDHVASIVNNRNNIAHGRSGTASIVTVGEWQKSVDKLVAFIEEQFQI